MLLSIFMLSKPFFELFIVATSNKGPPKLMRNKSKKKLFDESSTESVIFEFHCG